MTTNDPSIADAARIARAISHPVRLQILNELRGNGAYVMHLTAALGRPQANVSQHLMVLREAGLVRAIREGMTVLYQVSDPEVLTVVDTLLGLSQKRMTNRMAASAEGTGSENKRRPRGKCRCPRCRQESWPVKGGK